MKTFSVIFCFSFIIFACDDEKVQHKETSKDSLESIRTIDGLISDIDYGNAPEWFKTIKEHEKIVVRGYGKSRRADLAEEKAMLNAQLNMARRLAVIDSTNFMQNEIQQIAPYQIKKKERIQADNIWHAYILLEKSIE